MYGERMKQLRQKADLSQDDIAQRANVNRSSVSNWERASFPPLDAINKFCGILNIPLWQFFISDEELAQIKTGGKQIPQEYIMIIEEMMKLDQDIRNDIWEIFLAQLKLFRKTKGK